MSWSSDDLLDLVAIETEAPSNQSRLTNTQILKLATKELWAIVNPLLMTSAGHYFERRIVTDLTEMEQEYTIPDRAIGGRLALVEVGNPNDLYVNLPMADPSEWVTKNFVSGSSQCVGYFRNDKLVILNGPNMYSKLRVTYFERPGQLIETADARQITTVNTGDIVLSSALGTVTTGTPFDIVSNKSIYAYRGTDETGTVAGSTITFTPPSGTAVGDWVCPAGYSPIPQIPLDLHPVLISRVVSKVLEVLGDREGMAASAASADSYLAQFMNLIAPRAAQNAQKIVNPYNIGMYGRGTGVTR